MNSRYRESKLVSTLGTSRLSENELLNLMNTKQLRVLAKECGVPLVKEGFFGTSTATRKEEMIEILNNLTVARIRRFSNKIGLVGKPKQKIVKVKTKRRAIRLEEEEIKERITERKIVKRRMVKVEEVTVKSVVREIKKYRTPHIRGKQIEEKFTIGLTSFLMHIFPDIERKQPLAKGAIIDAIIDDNIGIEVKYRPSIAERDRLYGQVQKYLKRLNHVIVVLFDTSARDVQAFRKRVKKAHGKSVTVLNVV